LQFQAQFFNIFNRVNLQTPNMSCSPVSSTDPSCSPSNGFGSVTNDYLPRQGQLGMVFSF
jgi:hypothetical protein